MFDLNMWVMIQWFGVAWMCAIVQLHRYDSGYGVFHFYLQMMSVCIAIHFRVTNRKTNVGLIALNCRHTYHYTWIVGGKFYSFLIIQLRGVHHFSSENLSDFHLNIIGLLIKCRMWSEVNYNGSKPLWFVR